MLTSVTALFIISKMWKNSKVYQLVSGWIVYPHNGIIFIKNGNKIHMLWHGWTSKILYQIKEARYKRSHIVWAHLNKMSRKGKSIRDRKHVGGCWSLGCKWGLTRNRPEGSHWIDGDFLHLGYGNSCTPWCIYYKS